MTPGPLLVSIVTPVHNGAEFLSECIESVQGQTYQNWEYVIVNNCSTDRSPSIAEAFAQEDSRICLHNNVRFLTAVENQNHALRLISPASKYCKVVHADDLLFPRCVEEMVAVAEAYPTVGIVGSYRLSGTKVDLDGLALSEVCVSGREVCRRSLLNEFYVFGSPTSLLIRADLIRQRDNFYAESHLWADTEVCYELLRSCDFGFVHQVLSYSRRHPGALSSMAKRVDTYTLAELDLVTRFGPEYLTPTEHERRLDFLSDHYYRFMVRSVLGRREAAFWKLQKDGLQAIGLRFSLLRLLKAAAVMTVGMLTRPFRSLASAMQARQGL